MKTGILGQTHLGIRHTAPGCSQETLARSEVLHVQRCTHCGTVSLHLGPLTVRFDAASVESIWNTLGQALLTLHAEEDARARGIQA